MLLLARPLQSLKVLLLRFQLHRWHVHRSHGRSRRSQADTFVHSAFWSGCCLLLPLMELLNSFLAKMLCFETWGESNSKASQASTAPKPVLDPVPSRLDQDLVSARELVTELAVRGREACEAQNEMERAQCCAVYQHISTRLVVICCNGTQAFYYERLWRCGGSMLLGNFIY